MSRYFGDFEIDDFRGSGFGSGRDISRGPSTDQSPRTDLYRIHRAEDQADKLDREGRDRPPLAREERVQATLTQRIRTNYVDRDKAYSLRDSEIHTLSEIGKFRIVAMSGLAEFAYNSARARVEKDIEHLSRQGLVREIHITDIEYAPTPVVTLRR